MMNYLIVVPANAGTNNPRAKFSAPMYPQVKATDGVLTKQGLGV